MAERAEEKSPAESAQKSPVEKLPPESGGTNKKREGARIDGAKSSDNGVARSSSDNGVKVPKAQGSKRQLDAPDSEPPPSGPRDSIPPSVPDAPSQGPWRSYKEQVSQLAQRLVDGQRPIRVLQSIKWHTSVEEHFFKSKFKAMPEVGPEQYDPLDFDPREKAREFEAIARDAEAELGETDSIGQILVSTAMEYRDLCRMLEARGTKTFYAYSRKLYGSPKDTFPDGKSTVRDLGHVLYQILTHIDDSTLGVIETRNIPAEKAAAELNKRFAGYFGDDTVRVQVDDELLSDAAAGSDYVKVRSGAKFSQRDIDILEVHEGWVHVATSLNGQAQTVARWLSKGPPRTTTVQEGLAALLEIFTFRTYPRRARKLNDRIIAVDKAEDGASFLDVFEWYRTEGYSEEDCFLNTRRVFRGGTVDGGAPFTKDAAYCKGIVLNYAFIRSAVRHNRADLIPYLFAGKVAHEDVPVLARRVNDGVIKPPVFLPPMFRDLNGLAIWMAYSTFFSQLSDEETSDYYAKLFRSGE